jgi:peptidyl-prolyl cis-trans isomerase SurA
VRRRAIGRASLALLLLGLVGVLVAGCSIPSWVPVVGRSKAEPNLSAADVRQPVKVAPLLPGTTGQRRASGDDVVDRVICIVNNDAITQYELDEAEAYYYYESKQPQPEGDARRALRDQLLQRIIESRLQLQQAEREKVVIEDAELAEQMGEILKRMNVKNDTELAEALKAQGLTVDSVKKRVRDTLMVQKVIRRKVTLRISVTEQEIDRYLEQNRNKLETGLTFAARHILFLPEPAGGDDAWQGARRRADEAYAHVLAGDDFAELAKKFSDDGSGKDGGGLGPLKRGELAPEIEAEILKLRPGEISPPFRSAVGYHLFKLDARESLAGEALTHARNQVREILFREKYQARLTEWLTEIRRRAMIDMRL